ncbi:MAG: hypothetical protein LBE57_05205, partial [Methanosarcinales archaeon]|nr:hypothetical protein [Methanosarcinales archaeon]
MLNTQKMKEITEYAQSQLPASVAKYIPSRLPAFGKGSSNYPYAVTRIRPNRVKHFNPDEKN